MRDDINILKKLNVENIKYEKNPYMQLLMELGSETEIEDNRFVYLSNDVWYFDMECIEDHGDYVRIIERIKEIIKDEIVLNNIKDYVDIEDKKVTITFTVNGNIHTYDLEMKDDWIDTGVFGIFSKLLMDYGNKKRFFILR